MVFVQEKAIACDYWRELVDFQWRTCWDGGDKVISYKECDVEGGGMDSDG